MRYQPRHFADILEPDNNAAHPATRPDFSVGLVQISETGYWLNTPANSGWIVTNEGVVLIDSGVNSPLLIESVRKTTDRPVRCVIYTHGHIDHTFRLDRYAQIADEQTKVIAHALLPQRLERYDFLQGHEDRNNRVQFHAPGLHWPRGNETKYPDILYWGDYQFTLGGRRFELFHAYGETDDATVIHVPDEGIVFAGDLMMSSWPNLGNPYKVPRYGRGWYEALERIRDLNPRVVAPGHGRMLLREPSAIAQCLGDTIAGLRYVHDQVVNGLNEGWRLSRMQAEIHLPPELEDSPYLQQCYSRVELAVRAIHRGYTGWFEHDPSDLYAVPRDELSQAFRKLVGDDDAIVTSAKELWEAGSRTVAVELLQQLLRSNTELRSARELRRQFMRTLLDEDKCTMSRGVWHHFAELDDAFLSASSER